MVGSGGKDGGRPDGERGRERGRRERRRRWRVEATEEKDEQQFFPSIMKLIKKKICLQDERRTESRLTFSGKEK